ncbi:lipid phosphate phosphatase epsilon 1, chloroplastic [Abrus precatorius]|uniref:Lipid phosphate phosphatase epsilon 1, chloroplastic n=1 Tax=Abrus precatorius TaxID=3816 RepID=A0A8B8KVI1_ABRPR|nr:lipid phosphate phosphatase epsilon 1, chloroplastic [Abrus precatorius]
MVEILDQKAMAIFHINPEILMFMWPSTVKNQTLFPRQKSFAVANSMNGFIRTYDFRDGNCDEHVGVLEQQPFIDGSSKFRSKLSTLNRLSKWIVSALFGVLIFWRHDAEALWFAAGSMLNGMLSISLKIILNKKRPSSNLKSDPGMPSSHAQSIFFIAMFIILSSVEWLGINEISISSGGLVLAFGSYITYLRVSQKLHTVSQVVVGAFMGSICSFLWYWIWNAFMQHAFVSSLWVRIIVILGSARICVGFLSNVILHWLRDKLNLINMC